MKKIKRIVSILLSLALLLSAISVSFTVSAETVDGIIVNGDFEEGQKGFLNAEDADMNVKVYDNADSTRPGYGTVSIDGKAAYLPSMSETKKTDLLQYKIENLPAGTYTIRMDALVSVTDPNVWSALGFGLTDTIWSTGVAYGPNMISNTAKATKNGSAITVNSTALYHRLAGSTLTAGWSDVDVEISFSIAETKTLYLFMFSGATANAYIDNIVLERVSENGVINNGDFEEGQKGFLNAEDADMNVKVYDNSDTTRPGYGTVTLDGKAAYIPGGSTKNEHLQFKIENLPAGTYTIKMDALVNVTDASVWAALGFGITDTIYSVAGIAYGNPMINNTAKATKNGSAVTVNSINTYHRLAGSTLTAGLHDTDVEISFSIAETKTLYLFMFSGATANAYIDNIVLERVSENGVINNGNFEAGQKGFLNAEDAGMNVKVYDNSDTTRPGYGTVTLDGKAAYIPGGSTKNEHLQFKIENLPAGTYTIKMDALVNVTDASAWAALGFGITDTIYSVAGIAYGNPMINNTAKATKNGGAVTVNSINTYHRLAGSTLTAGLHDTDVEISFSISENKTLYLFMFATEGKSSAYIDNISMIRTGEAVTYPEIDVTKTNKLTMDNEDFSKLYISSSNQDNNGMKIEIIQSGDSKYGNVLRLPSYTSDNDSERTKSARFYTKYTGLVVGKTYSVNFDMKMPSFTKGSAQQWLGLVGVTHREPAKDSNQTYSNTGISLPKKITTYTDKGGNTPISIGTPVSNWNTGVFKWNDLGSEEWINYTFDFVAEDTVAYFFIENYLKGISDFLVDNISVTESATQLDGQINLIPDGSDKIAPAEGSKNVLLIGNSFASHTISIPLLEVINDNEALLNVARYGKGAMPPGYLANQISNDGVNMEFAYAGKGNAKLYTQKGNVSRDSVKNFAKWDYILVQAFTTGESNTENWTDLIALVDSVKTYLSSENTKVLVWVPQSVSQSYCDTNYGGADAIIYKNYHDALAKDLETNIYNGSIKADGIFNVNETFWIARKLVGAEGVHGDGLHINKTGAYLMGLAIHKLVCGTDPTTDFDVRISERADIDKALKEAVNGIEGSIDVGDCLVNGDFEEGQKGFLNAEDAEMKIKVYDNADESRPGYGTVTLDGKAAYIPGGSSNKYDYLQYKIEGLPTGRYTISFDTNINVINKNVWTALGFGITNTFYNVAGVAYGSGNMINTTGEQTAAFNPVGPDKHSVKANKNGNAITINSINRYHRIAGASLSEGWNDVNIEITFEIDETQTLYLFMFATADNSSAYIDNIKLYKSAKLTYSFKNVLNEDMYEGKTEELKIDTNTSIIVPVNNDYNLMGYKFGDGQIICEKFNNFAITSNTEITFIYALKGDLNNDLFVNSLDLAELRKYLLGVSVNCNISGANANGDEVVDIRDLVALKKKLIGLSLEDKKIVNANIDNLRDPYMFVEDDVYYLYGTGGLLYKNTSRTLSGNWQYVGSVVEKPEIATGNYFWAPEVYKYNDSYYMITSYYSSVNEKRGCAIFKADSPEGPFVQISNGTITPSDKYCIDGTLYIDDDNQPWLIYSEEYIEADNKVGGMYAAKLSADLTSLISEPIELFKADEASWSSGTVSEGPYIYRCKNGELLMLVSGFKKGTGNDRYCVGIARSSNGDIDGNWTIDDTLLYSSDLSDGYDGGHGMIFKSLTGQLYLSIHSPNDIEDVNEKPVFIPIKEENNTLVWDVK